MMHFALWIKVSSSSTPLTHIFNDDEKLIARALADLGAIAAENARLYGRVFDSEESLRKSERLTTVGTMAAGIAQ